MNIHHISQEGRCLKLHKLIICDECFMTIHHSLTTVDKFLHDFMGQYILFEGKCIILGRDEWQNIPVAIHANIIAIIEKYPKSHLFGFILEHLLLYQI